MTIRGNIRGIDIVLQVPHDNVDPIEKGLKVQINHTDDSYDY
jgi:hypothetical protein